MAVCDIITCDILRAIFLAATLAIFSPVENVRRSARNAASVNVIDIGRARFSRGITIKYTSATYSRFRRASRYPGRVYEIRDTPGFYDVPGRHALVHFRAAHTGLPAGESRFRTQWNPRYCPVIFRLCYSLLSERCVLSLLSLAARTVSREPRETNYCTKRTSNRRKLRGRLELKTIRKSRTEFSQSI